MRILSRGIDDQSPVLVDKSYPGIRFEVRVLYVGSAVGLLNDDITFGEGLRCIAFTNDSPVKEIALGMNQRGTLFQGVFRVEHDQEILISDVYRFECFLGRFLVRCSNKGDRFSHKPDFFMGKERLVLVDETKQVLARD